MIFVGCGRGGPQRSGMGGKSACAKTKGVEMRKKYFVAIVMSLFLGACEATTGVQTVLLPTSGRSLDYVFHRTDTKGCPEAVGRDVYDWNGSLIDAKIAVGNSIQCHAVDQLGGVAQGVGLGVGLSNLKPAQNNTSIENGSSSEVGDVSAKSEGGKGGTGVGGTGVGVGTGGSSWSYSGSTALSNSFSNSSALGVGVGIGGGNSGGGSHGGGGGHPPAGGGGGHTNRSGGGDGTNPGGHGNLNGFNNPGQGHGN